MASAKKDNIIRLNLEQASRAVVICFMANVPVVLWGDPGIGKSAVVQQIAARLDYKLYDVRSSNKERSDFSIPFPDNGRVQYLVTETLPFEKIVGDEKSILFFDEFDRTTQEVMNALLQVIHDRSLDGHHLSPNCLICAAGNGASDIGTTPPSRAAMNRMCHLYIEAHSDSANRAWKEWAADNDVSDEMISYNDFVRQGDDGTTYEESAYRTRRSMVNADKIYRVSKGIEFKKDDVMLALVAGCIGASEGRQFLAYIKTMASVPSIKDICGKPNTVRVPDEPSEVSALGDLMLRTLSGVPTEKELSLGLAPNKSHPYVECREQMIDAFIQYADRWPEEPKTYFTRRLVSAFGKGVQGRKSYTRSGLNTEKVKTVGNNDFFKIIEGVMDGKHNQTQGREFRGTRIYPALHADSRSVDFADDPFSDT